MNLPPDMKRRFVSTALFRREGAVLFRPPRKEFHRDPTQARKAAARFWNGAVKAPDLLRKIILVSRHGEKIEVAERIASERRWQVDRMSPREAEDIPYLAACMTELGVDPHRAQPPMPDILEINGVIYRRDI